MLDSAIKRMASLVLLGTALMCGSTAGAAAMILPAPQIDDPLIHSPSSSDATLVLAGGCFWGMQAVFQHVKGVKQVTAGYAGGDATTATYPLVSTGTTGHAESVQVTYDPSLITLGKILQIYFAVAHDPTELNRQGPDHGTQYRSTIFYTTSQQQKIAAAYISQLNSAHSFPSTIVTTLEPLKAFYKAEGYHQNYAELNPTNSYIATFDLPKLTHLEEQFPDLYIK